MEDMLLSQTYGEALFAAASERGMQEDILEEILCLAKLLETSPELREFLQGDAISFEEKKEYIESVFHEMVSEEMILFLIVLLKKGQIRQISRIAGYYKLLYDRQRGESTGKIYSAVPLSFTQVAAFETAVSTLLRKKYRLENCVDPSFTDNVMIQVDGRT